MSKKKVLLRGVFINRDTNGEGVLKVGTTLIRVSTVMGILYIIFATIVVAFLAIIWLLGYKMIYKKILHGKKQISIGRIGLVCVLAVYIVVVLYVTLLRGGIGFGGFEYRANFKPFSSYKEAWYNFSAREWRNLILNICMFVPFGFLLPICFGKIKRAWKIYLCGFGFALFIEVVQLITGRGVFETDDIINNTIGAMIGYGLFSVARLIFVAVCSRKKVQDNTNEVSGVAHDENVCERQNISIRKCLVAQLPLAFTIIAFAAVFIVYNSMEYGNLSIDNISNQNVDVSMADGVSLADEADPLDVYTIHRATEDEARELADGYFSKYGVLIDDSKTDIYDDTIIFYSTSLDDEGSNLSIWCDYEGPTVSFTDFSNIDDENSYADAGLSEEFVREKLENLGVVIPENAVFAPIEEYDAGNYRFTNDGEILDDGLYYKGTIECCINSSGKIANFRDSMIKYTPYKKVDVISEKEAYDRLCAGKFYFPDYDKDEQLSDLVVKSVKISYTPDSKGYYRPVYEFVANANQDTGKREISIMVDAMEI